jgi:hypothetical protein
MSRYDPLTAKLSNDPNELVELTFEDIDELVGGLPKSARKNPGWWSNGQSCHQSRYWTSAQRRARPDLDHSRVRFVRSDEIAEIVAINEKAAPRADETSELTTRFPVQLTVTGEHLRTIVSFEWQSAEEIRERAGKLEMPQLPPKEGIYRFRIEHVEGDVSYHIGQAENLFRQMGHYRTANGTKQGKVSETLARTLRTGGRVSVDVVTAALCGGESLDFKREYARSLVESLAIAEAERTGLSLEGDKKNRE